MIIKYYALVVSYVAFALRYVLPFKTVVRLMLYAGDLQQKYHRQVKRAALMGR